MYNEKINPFLVYATQLEGTLTPEDFKEEIKFLLVENIKTLSQNALSNSFCKIDSSLAHQVVPLSLNLKTCRFVPLKKKSVGDYLASLAPSSVWTSLGWEEENMSEGGQIIQDFFNFFASYLHLCQEMEVENFVETAIEDFVELKKEKNSFFLYFLKESRCLDSALSYLTLYYKCVERYSDGAIIEKSKNILVSLKACSLRLQGLNFNQVYLYLDYTDFFCERDLFHILKVEKYDCLKKILSIRKNIFKKKYIKNKLNSAFIDFFLSCLRMSESELQGFCKKIESILTNYPIREKKEKLSSLSKGDRFLATLLKIAFFSPIHDHCARKLLRERKAPNRETEQQYRERCESKYVKRAEEHARSELVKISLEKKVREKKVESSQDSSEEMEELYLF